MLILIQILFLLVFFFFQKNLIIFFKFTSLTCKRFPYLIRKSHKTLRVDPSLISLKMKPKQEMVSFQHLSNHQTLFVIEIIECDIQMSQSVFMNAKPKSRGKSRRVGGAWAEVEKIPRKIERSELDCVRNDSKHINSKLLIKLVVREI